MTEPRIEQARKLMALIAYLKAENVEEAMEALNSPELDNYEWRWTRGRDFVRYCIETGRFKFLYSQLIWDAELLEEEGA